MAIFPFLRRPTQANPTYATLGGVPADNVPLKTALGQKADLDSTGKIPVNQTNRQHRFTYAYPAGQTTPREYQIIDFDAAGYYAPEIIQNVSGISYFLNDVQVAPDGNGRFLLALLDHFRIEATTAAGTPGFIQLTQVLN